MAATKQVERTEARDNGVLVLKLNAHFGGDEDTDFDRADLIVDGIPHDESSYRVDVFFNLPTADAETPHTLETGYAGSFSVFGHGGCFGGAAHCDINSASTDVTAKGIATARPHPLTPKRKIMTVTEQLKRTIAQDGALETVTFVPMRVAPKRKDCGPAADLFTFENAVIQTYR